MKRGILIGLLAAGTVLGFGAGFSRLYWHRHGDGHHRWGRHAIEDRAAEACVRAAERVMKERAGPAGTTQSPAAAP
jgi:hypothetical protein